MPFAVALLNAKWLPSGLHTAKLSFGFGGKWTGIPVPSGIFRSSSELLNVALCRPFVFGLMRIPAMRSIGSASSAIGG